MPSLSLPDPAALVAFADSMPSHTFEPLAVDLKAVLEFEPLRVALLGIVASHPEAARVRARLRGFSFAAKLIVVAGPEVAVALGPYLWTDRFPAYEAAFADTIAAHIDTTFAAAAAWAPTVAPPPPPPVYHRPSARWEAEDTQELPAPSQPSHQPYPQASSAEGAAIAALTSQVAWLTSNLRAATPALPATSVLFDTGAYLREEDWRSAWDTSQVRDLLAQLREKLVASTSITAASAIVDSVVHVINAAKLIPSDRSQTFYGIIWPVVRNFLSAILIADTVEAAAATVDPVRFAADAYSDLHAMSPWTRDNIDRTIRARVKAAPPRRRRDFPPRRPRATGGADRAAHDGPPRARSASAPRSPRKGTPRRKAK